MRKVVVYELMSLDGVAENPDAFLAEWDDAAEANLAAVIAKQDTVVLGRRSYDEWSAFWPDSDIEPFASFINAVPKYVMTSTPLEREWTATTVIDSAHVDVVRKLKEGAGGDIGVHASISVARSLLAAEVVDEVQLAIAPYIIGTGRRLLDDVPASNLELIDIKTSDNGWVLVGYRVLPRA